MCLLCALSVFVYVTATVKRTDMIKQAASTMLAGQASVVLFLTQVFVLSLWINCKQGSTKAWFPTTLWMCNFCTSLLIIDFLQALIFPRVSCMRSGASAHTNILMANDSLQHLLYCYWTVVVFFKETQGTRPVPPQSWVLFLEIVRYTPLGMIYS